VRVAHVHESIGCVLHMYVSHRVRGTEEAKVKVEGGGGVVELKQWAGLDGTYLYLYGGKVLQVIYQYTRLHMV
jgi:hypothetical protein